MSFTTRFPFVSVPVLSKAMVSTLPIRSKASPDLIITPCFVACPIAAIIAVGVASTNAQGQNTTRTVTARTMSLVTINAIIAINNATGTSQLAALSAIRAIGAFLFSASSTIRISFCKELSSPSFEARISIVPKRLIVPQKTLSPTVLSTGKDSPVIIDWSTEVVPSIISPSTGILSPGRTRRISFILISSAAIISSFPFEILRPCCGVRLISFFNPFFALSVVFSSKIAPIAIIKATSPAANKSPMAIAAIIAIEINNADEILLIP